MLRLATVLALGLLLSGASAVEPPCSYVVQAGDSIFAIGQKYELTQAEVEAANPTVDDISLIQPGDVLLLPCTGNATEADTVLDLLARRQDTSILYQAVLAAGPDFVTMLNDTELVGTLFAPINWAWEQVLTRLNMTAEDLFADKELLSTLLKYHFDPEAALEADSLENGQNISTALEGQQIVVYKPRDILRLGTTSGKKVRVVDADLAAGNVLVHTVKNVLWPATSLVDLPDPTGDCVHTVAQGDTVFNIAQMYGTSVDALIDLNPDLEADNGARLQIGTELVLFPSCVV